MIDKNDFIIKEYKCSQRKNGKAKHKKYRLICDICGALKGYGFSRTKKGKAQGIDYCKKCQYEKLSKQFVNQIECKCEVCGKEFTRPPSRIKRAKSQTCSHKCTGILKRKDITEVNRSQLKNKLFQMGIKPICKSCGHNHFWNLQAHHIIFVMNGGKNTLDNLEFQCRCCHSDIHYYYGKDDQE